MYLNSAIVYELSPLSSIHEREDSSKRYMLIVIRSVVCRYFGIPEFKLPRRGKKTKYDEEILPAQIAMYLSCLFTPASLSTIARVFGLKDHTSVIYSRETIKDRMANEPAIRVIVEHIKKELNL